ncbi:ATP-dependent 6-phosphofructokinase 3-like [Magnolia sinica]|uniref:ATP-dependent 6-phosphofructokinase 3-like n=1 Tax=Magnolia sinica TaxID=86752 RepID=UPI00265873E0|nr:ATP-dependent 6-phosphofructokinase 3-like [Magnolia sinica]
MMLVYEYLLNTSLDTFLFGKLWALAHLSFADLSKSFQDNVAYSVVKQYFVHVDDTVPQKIVVHKNSPRGIHFRRACSHQKVITQTHVVGNGKNHVNITDMSLDVIQVYFESDEVHACIVTCGGLCPGLNTVIREIVCGLHQMYGVSKILGIEVSYYKKNRHYRQPKPPLKVQKTAGIRIPAVVKVQKTASKSPKNRRYRHYRKNGYLPALIIIYGRLC